MNLQNTCYTSIFIELIRSKWCKILTCSKGRKTCLLLLTKGESMLVQWPTPRHRRAWCFKLQHQSHLLRRPDQPKKNALLVMGTKKLIYPNSWICKWAKYLKKFNTKPIVSIFSCDRFDFHQSHNDSPPINIIYNVHLFPRNGEKVQSYVNQNKLKHSYYLRKQTKHFEISGVTKIGVSLHLVYVHIEIFPAYKHFLFPSNLLCPSRSLTCRSK